jgi:hypothetical protein
MYTGKHARIRPLQRAFIMAASGEPGPIASWRGAATGSHICFRRRGGPTECREATIHPPCMPTQKRRAAAS